MQPRRYVFGFLTARSSGDARKVWNDLLAKEGIDGFFDFYPTRSREDLQMRLSEMFHLGRAAYVLSPKLSEVVEPLLDRTDASVTQQGSIDTVLNEQGVLVGYALGHLPKEQQLQFWIKKTKEQLSD